MRPLTVPRARSRSTPPRGRPGACWLLAAAACAAPPEPRPAASPYEQAVERWRADDGAGSLAQLGRALEEDPAAVQRALLEPEFERGGLRDRPEFRELLRAAAVRHRISHVTLARADEPGEWIEIEGLLVDAGGAPVPGGEVYLFATDAEGRYHPRIEGERLPRLFGTVVSDAAGRFTLRTVRPGPYPGTRNARHVHVAAHAGALRLAVPGYVVFDDDPLLAEPQNAEQRAEAARIRMRTEDGRARGELVLPLR